jgi:hypothetical protein
VAALVLCLGVVVAAATTGKATIKYSAKKPSTATALQLGATFPTDDQGQQPILTSVTLVLAKGTKIDSGALAACDYVAPQSGSGPPPDCPPDTQVGGGTADLLLGDAMTPVTFDAAIFNQKPGPLLVLSLNGTVAYTVTSTVKGNKITFPLSLAESIKARTQKVDLTFDNKGKPKKPYLRTPATCPKSHKWKGAIQADVSGGGKENLPATSPCKKPKANH